MTVAIRPGQRRHHVDAVGEEDGLGDVVGDQQHRRADLAPDLEQPLLQLGARDPVERAEGLVQQHRRLAEQHRAQEGGALAHAARELPRPARSNPPSPKRSSSGRARARAAAADAGELEADRDVVDRPPPRQQRVALGHEGAGAEPAGAGRPSISDLARVGMLEPGEDVEQRALAGAAGADQRHELAGLRRRGRRGRASAAARSPPRA